MHSLSVGRADSNILCVKVCSRSKVFLRDENNHSGVDLINVCRYVLCLFLVTVRCLSACTCVYKGM